MIEGGSSKTFSKSKTMLFDQPALAHQLLEKIAESVTSYLNAQVAAGAQALMIFDTWGGSLNPEMYQVFSLDYMQKIVRQPDTVKAKAEGTGYFIYQRRRPMAKQMADTGCDGLGLDWTMNIADARAQVGDRVALQGNMDPNTLYASPETIRAEAAKILAGFGHGSGHIFNLGHGITPDINPEHVKVLVDSVHELSEQYHR